MSRLRNVGMLAAGTAVAQVVSLGVAPLLTRLYSPADFGLLAVFSSLASVAAMAVSWRLELAVPVPAEDSEAVEVVSAGLGVVAGMTALAAVAVAVFGSAIAEAMGEPELAGMLVFLPVYLVGAGVFNMLNFWFARQDRFATVAVINTFRAFAVAALQYALGLLAVGPAGLVAGQSFGPVTRAVAALFAGRQGDRRLPIVWVPPRRLAQVLAKYRHFVVYGTPQALVNALNQSLPAIVLTFVFDASVAGFYLMAHRLIAAPIGLLGRSVRQVIYPHLARALEERQALPIALRSAFYMAAIAVPIAAVVFIFGPQLFAWVLGPEWRIAGEFARFLVLWMAVGFVNIPSVSLIPLLEMQRWHAMYELIYLTARLGALLYGARTGDPLQAIFLFAMVGVAFNSVLVAWPLMRLRALRGRRSG